MLKSTRGQGQNRGTHQRPSRQVVLSPSEMFVCLVGWLVVCYEKKKTCRKSETKRGSETKRASFKAREKTTSQPPHRRATCISRARQRTSSVTHLHLFDRKHSQIPDSNRNCFFTQIMIHITDNSPTQTTRASQVNRGFSLLNDDNRATGLNLWHLLFLMDWYHHRRCIIFVCPDKRKLKIMNNWRGKADYMHRGDS